MTQLSVSNPMLTIRSLKGAALSVLVALVVARAALQRESLSALELQDWTGYSDENITKGARLLTSMALIVKARIGWALAEGVQFVLPGLFDIKESDNIGLSLLTTTTTMNREGGDNVVVVNKTPIISESLDLLMSLGVGRKMAETLAGMNWATVEYIRAHAARVALPDDIGLLITRIRDHDPMPGGKCQAQSVEDRVGEFLKRTR